MILNAIAEKLKRQSKVDFLLTAKRDLDAAKRFFRKM